MSGLSQQKYNENVNTLNQGTQEKSQSRSNIRGNDQHLQKDIPNMKVNTGSGSLNRPNTVGYKEINASTKSATGGLVNNKSQTMAPQSLQ